MKFTFDNNMPIYIQLVEQIKVYIISGALQPGERLPSVRELALQSQSNPNTVQKALSELETMGLIYTERTNGKFISKDAACIAALREKYAGEVVTRFLADMQKLGYTAEETLRCIKELGENDK